MLEQLFEEILQLYHLLLMKLTIDDPMKTKLQKKKNIVYLLSLKQSHHVSYVQKVE
jgi:hypothetical protein